MTGSGTHAPLTSSDELYGLVYELRRRGIVCDLGIVYIRPIKYKANDANEIVKVTSWKTSGSKKKKERK